MDYLKAKRMAEHSAGLKVPRSVVQRVLHLVAHWDQTSAERTAQKLAASWEIPMDYLKAKRMAEHSAGLKVPRSVVQRVLHLVAHWDQTSAE